MGTRLGSGDLTFQDLFDSGMDNLFKLGTRDLLRGGRTENHPADLASIDFTFGGEDTGAENVANSLFDLRFLQD